MKNNFKAKYGPWAIVTGGSAGIGKSYATELAGIGLNVALIGRNQVNLEKAKAEIIANHSVEVRIISADLNTEEGIVRVIEQTSDLEVGLLINNAGNAFVHSFLGVAEDKLTSNLTLNLIAPLKLTHHLGRKMEIRGGGGVIFLSSMAGYQGISKMSTYSAEKAFILTLGESLYFELKKQGIDVMVVSPGATDTDLGRNTAGMDNSKLPIPYMSPEILVRKSFARFGDSPSMIPGFMNNLTAFIGKRVLSRKSNSALWSSIIGRAAA
jgi:uncharacterized protein